MPPEHWAYKRQSRETFLAWAQRVGPQTKQQVEKILRSKAHDEQAFRSLRGIQQLGTRYGHRRLEDACGVANTFALVGYRRLKSILQSNRDSTPAPPEKAPSPPIEHDNLRGQPYYA